MATYTLRPEAWASSIVPDGATPGTGTNFFDLNANSNAPYTVSGSGDGGSVLRVEGEGGDITAVFGVGGSAFFFFLLLRDDGTLPIGATIDAVKIRLRAKGVGVGLSVFDPNAPILLSETYNLPIGNVASFPITVGTLGPAYSWLETAVMTINPATGEPWVRRDFFQNPADTADGFGSWEIGMNTATGDPAAGGETFGFDAFEVIINPGGSTQQWCFNPTSNRYVFAAECPGPPFISGVDAPVPMITGFSPRST